MGINNYEKFRKPKGLMEIKADSNYNIFVNAITQLANLGSNDKMLTNLDAMKQQLNKLVEEGYLKTTDLDYQQLEGVYKSAVDIQKKPAKSYDDISNFFFTYNNFQDIYSRKIGEER